MRRLIECVPNFSEGRDLAKVDELVTAMSGVPGAWVLDRASDVDHNRSVITLAGEPEAVAEASIRGVGKAAELIDLTRHTGVHPRIGATDVLPIIPLDGVSIEECVALARQIGHEIWKRHRIPIYFYEAAALKPERANLEHIRSGQFEGLRDDAFRNPDRSPDIGEPRLHSTAGAVAVGVRKLLIAYNIHLNTNDVYIAKEIAKTIRFSSGGLRYVKAIGVGLEARGIAQVSINLTDFEQTPLHRVFEMVKREAERHGCAVVGSETIGLIPRKAIELSAEYYLQFENFSPVRVLENRLAAAIGNVPLPLDSGAEEQTLTRPVLTALRHASGALASAIATGARTHSSSYVVLETRIDADLEMALAGVQIFEQAVQLEATATPSMLPDLRIVARMAIAAAEAAFENARASLASIQSSDQQKFRSYVETMKPRLAAVEARLTANRVVTNRLSGI